MHRINELKPYNGQVPVISRGNGFNVRDLLEMPQNSSIKASGYFYPLNHYSHHTNSSSSSLESLEPPSLQHHLTLESSIPNWSVIHPNGFPSSGTY